MTATLLGSVTDASGAVVPNATVTATQTGTGIARATTTNRKVYTVRICHQERTALRWKPPGSEGGA
ncbi:MAG: carboxypeptidase-like regulatory domain-containing protein [Bryobacteraceae bacterium]